MKADARLLRRLQKGDQVAWTQFYNKWAQPLYNFILHNGITDPFDVEEVMSDTWLAAPRAIENFDGQNATLKTFLYSLARRKIADHWRRHKPTDELPETLSQVEEPQERLILQEALASMPEHEREVLLLRYNEGFSVSEIAEIMGRTYKGTESLLSRARKRLQGYL